MQMATTTGLFAFGGRAPGAQQPYKVFEAIDLGAEFDYFAWVTTPYYNILPGGVLNDTNCVAADIFEEADMLLGGTVTQVPITVFGGKLGSLGQNTNLRAMARRGRARVIWFRLLVYGTALEVGAQGCVFFDF